MTTTKMQLGTLNTLTIDRKSDHGLYLVDAQQESVLLPNLYVKDSMKIGEELEVFLYTDSEDRLVATTKRPLAMVGEFALMRVKDTTSFGAFVDWGLPKDLLVPKKMQKEPLQKDKSYIIRVVYDQLTERLIGDTKIGRYLSYEKSRTKHLKKVDLLIIAKTPLGYKAIVNNQFEGMLYHNEIFTPLKVGEKRVGYVKKVREDGKLDLSLQPSGKAKEDVAAKKILQTLQKSQNNTLPFTYKSDALEIQKEFGISKKAYKKALTKLLDKGQITLLEDGIVLKEKS